MRGYILYIEQILNILKIIITQKMQQHIYKSLLIQLHNTLNKIGTMVQYN